MTYNTQFHALQPYPFERLRALTEKVTPNPELKHIPLSLGEPKHSPPQFVIDTLSNSQTLTTKLAQYPATKGTETLRQAICDWFAQRFGPQLSVEDHVLPVNGTREALFSFAQAMLSGASGSIVLMPNPFYQIYEGAALLAGAQPQFVNNDPANDYHQDFTAISDQTWHQVELVYLCSPGNPTGQIAPRAQLQNLIELAHKHDFIIAADECYSELYFDDAQAPTSLLEVSDSMGNQGFARCVVFHSLSKRSNLPGLRSGFVAGDAKLMAPYLKYRTYHGCALGAHHQLASELAWQDETHVIANRQLYRDKFAAVTDILAPHYPLRQPAGGFYHWLETPIDDQAFCTGLLTEQNITVMPGSFLGRSTHARNPGEHHVRIAWVAAMDDCVDAAQRLAAYAASQ